jgi:hypothetical protein
VIDLLGLVGFGAFLAVSAVVGFRLLLLARRTRRLPELAIGLNFVFAGLVGYGLLIAAESLRVLPPPWDGWGSLVGVTFMSLGCFALSVFTRRVFRPDAFGATFALGALGGWLALGVVGSWFLHVAKAEEGTAGVWLGHWAPNLGMLAAYAWSSWEPLRYHRQLRLRAAMGLGDPLIANRMLLWALGTGAIACVAAVHFVTQLQGVHALPESLVGVVSMLVLVTACAQWLAFFPPRGYVRRFASPSA